VKEIQLTTKKSFVYRQDTHRMFLGVLLVCAVGVASAASPGKSSVRKGVHVNGL
jgi:hypothetical protein